MAATNDSKTNALRAIAEMRTDEETDYRHLVALMQAVARIELNA